MTLLDANSTKSWQDGHIASAIDFKGSEASLARLLPKDKSALVVAYCGGPKRMAYKAAAAAAQETRIHQRPTFARWHQGLGRCW